MHIREEGVLVRFLRFLLAKEQCWDAVNKRVKALPKYPTLRPLPNGIARIKKPQKLNREILKLTTGTAEEFGSFMQWSWACLYGLIADTDFHLWMRNLRIEFALHSTTFSKEHLHQLQEELNKVRFEIRQLFEVNIVLLFSFGTLFLFFFFRFFAFMFNIRTHEQTVI